jgi:IclR family mhp operon transcriptional activator
MIVRVTTNFDTPMILDRHSVGFRVPMLYATTGLCFLALCSEAERRAVLDLARQANDPREQLVHDVPGLEAKLAHIRQYGFCAIEHPEYREGNVGVPLTIYGRVVGGIVMRYIKIAMQAEKMLDYYVPLLRQLSRDIQLECETRLNDRLGRSVEGQNTALTESEDHERLDLH